MVNTKTLLAALLLLAGCSPSVQGLRFRGESPPIDEAFRKLTLAITVDGYEIARIDPEKFSLETRSRPLKDHEKSAEDLKLADGMVESQITVSLERRGRMYDVFVTPFLLYSNTSLRMMPPVQHPLMRKWQRIVGDLIRKETRGGD